MNRAKTITLTVLLFLFAAIIPCSACWYEYDDDWYDYWDDDWDDNWYDYVDDFNSVNPVELPEVVITPNHDDTDNDWWRRDYDDDSWNDNSDNDLYDVYEENEPYPVEGNNESNKAPYQIKSSDRIVSKIELPPSWPKQNAKGLCVPTAMEYLSAILREAKSRDFFINEYNRLFDATRNVERNGIPLEHLSSFIHHEFYTQQVSVTSIIFELDNNRLILYDMNGNSNGIFPTSAHEIVIIGYSEDKTKYIYLDPWTGNYYVENKFSLCSQQGTAYSVSGVK